VSRFWAWGLLVVGAAGVAGCHVISPEHLKNKPAEALAATPVSRAVDVEDDALSMAADGMAAGDDAAAAKHLARHVKAFPDQLVFRNQLAELEFKLGKYADAQTHFAKFDEAAAGSARLLGQRIHCHTRLMEIAQAREDGFAEKLHRAVGLHLIAGEVQSKHDDPAALSPDAEKLWCRAAAELKAAGELRPEDARCAWYQHVVWTKLDQPRPAEKALRTAAANAAFSPLPPGEEREMRAALASSEYRAAK